MACFLVPMALAVATSLMQKAARGLAEKLKLWVLSALLWGGVVLLAVEHVWHGEVVPWPPFLTAMTNPVEIPIMLHEMATIGSAMSAAILATWGTILAVNHYVSKMATIRALEQAGKPHVT
ncbi:MAG: hypothetical protein N3F65_00995 [Nitrososphaeria archaeon]|nr:hypothetical protein [Nitrososphaeria archaeon]